MQKQQNPAPLKPVELALEELEHVAGGLPKGGWHQDGDAAASDTTSSATATATSTSSGL